VLLAVIVIVRDFKRLLALIGVKNAKSRDEKRVGRWKSRFYVPVKLAVICIILADNIYPYAKAGDFNHDKAAKPLLYGAYTVSTFVKNGDTLAPLLTDEGRWKRVFIHSRGYFITQGMNDEMADYKLAYDTLNKKLVLEGYDAKEPLVLNYASRGDSVLILSGGVRSDLFWVETWKINLKELPVMQNGFHWTIDE
jgi:hypothetical protein